MINIGFFSEMKLYEDSGSIKSLLQQTANYDKEKVISYLKVGKKIASCPRAGIDCVTMKNISDSFSLYTDEEYCWGDFLIYHINKYNIRLPENFLKKINT